ncbi:hypothetical protein RhiLY_00478 [Ceratobasidium sp. AG-Ba]|nr:hypothetical protein RhiLY_00478 [Ceratobasidium sp. AG-Ba]
MASRTPSPCSTKTASAGLPVISSAAERNGEWRTRALYKRRERTAVECISGFPPGIAAEGHLFVAVNCKTFLQPVCGRRRDGVPPASRHMGREAWRLHVSPLPAPGHHVEPPPSPSSSILSPSPNTAVSELSAGLAPDFHHPRARLAIADLSRTLADLSSPEYRPSEDNERADVVCCCGNIECPASRAWAAAERKLAVSAGESTLSICRGIELTEKKLGSWIGYARFVSVVATRVLVQREKEVGQALLERHEAFTRRHEALVKQVSPFPNPRKTLQLIDSLYFVLPRILRLFPPLFTSFESAQTQIQNDAQTEHITTLNTTNAALQDQLVNHTRLQKQLAQSQLNLDAADASNRVLTKELQDARASITRLSAAHTRAVGLEEKLRIATEERDDLKREASEAATKVRMWETRANEAGSKCRKLQAEVSQLRDEAESIRLSRSEISSDILEDARARLQMLLSSLGHAPITSDDPEITRVLEALVADNEALKRDAAELQNMLTESREDVRTLQEEITEMRARGEGGQEPLGEDVTDMSFARSTPPPYNTLHQGHGRRLSSASTKSGWAASFASPRAAVFPPGARTPPVPGQASSSRIMSPPSARRVSSSRAVPPLVIPPMRRRLARASSVDEGGLPALGLTRATVDDTDADTMSINSNPMTSPHNVTVVPPNRSYRRASAENSATSERHSPIPSVDEDETKVESAPDDSNASIVVDGPESPEKPKPQRRPLMLLSRSRGVQTDDFALPATAYSQSSTPTPPIPSPRPGSISLTTSDTPSSPIIGPALPLNAEHLAALLNRLQHADHSSHDCRRRQDRVGQYSWGARAYDPGYAGRDYYVAGVVNDVVLDPAAVARVREEAFAGTTMAPTEEAGGLISIVERGRQTLLRSGKKRLAPRVAPAIATSTTTVNVEFASTGTRRAVSTMIVAPDTIAPPPVPVPEPVVGRSRSRGPIGDRDLRKEHLRGIFVGSQAAKARDRDRSESWVILPSVNSRKANQAILVDTSGDATIRARERRMSRNVDAVVDIQALQGPGQQQLLERTLRPRGLSDSSIRSTFIAHGTAAGANTVGRRGGADMGRRSRMPTMVDTVEIVSSPYDVVHAPVIMAAPPPTAIPKPTAIPFRAPSTITSISDSTSTSPTRPIPGSSRAVTESVPGSMVSGAPISSARFPRRPTWGVLSDEEDSFQVGSFKEGVSFTSGSMIRHRDRASGRGVSERMHIGG